MFMSLLKIVLDGCTILGTCTNVNKLFKVTGGNRTATESVAGIIFGLTCGCWAAGRVNNLLDAVEDAVKDAKFDFEINKPTEDVEVDDEMEDKKETITVNGVTYVKEDVAL